MMSDSNSKRKVTYRLYPTPRQSELLEALLRHHQQLYNAALEERISAWQKAGKSISYADQCASLTQLRNELPEWATANCSSQQMTLRRLDKAYQAFFRRVKNGEKPGFRGHFIYQREAAYNALKDIFSHHMPVHIHCNGDAAIDEAFLLIDSLQQQQLQHKELRNVLVHAQVCRPDQVKIFKKLNIIPSWFPTHTYLWGDWYLNSVLGLPRAAHISPLKDGLDNGILFTIHHDSPVTPPDLITAVYAAVNRTTRSGKILGADQRVSPYEALKAITINAAYQYGEEASKGSLVKGKRADLVILDQDPLQINPQALKDIRVIETIKDGISVYKRVP